MPLEIWLDDSFQEPEDTPLDEHVAGSGQGWLKAASNAYGSFTLQDAIIKGGAGYVGRSASPTGVELYEIDGQPPSLDYNIEFDFSFINAHLPSSPTVGIIFRAFNDEIAGLSGVGYIAEAHGSLGRLRFYRKDYATGTFTVIGEVLLGFVFTSGQTYTARIEVSGNTFDFYLDDVLKLSVTDSTYSGSDGENKIWLFCNLPAASGREWRIHSLQILVDNPETDPCLSAEPLDLPMYDEFDGPNNTPLSSHVSDTGNAWIEGHGIPAATRRSFFGSSPVLPLVLNGQGALVNQQDWRIEAAHQLVYAPRTKNFDIGVCFNMQSGFSSASSLYIFWRDTTVFRPNNRYQPLTGKRYELRIASDGSMYLRKRNYSEVTILDSDSGLWSPGANNYVRIHHVDDSIEVYLNEALVLSATDAAITETGTVTIQVYGRALLSELPKGLWRLNWFYLDDSYAAVGSPNKAVVLSEQMKAFESLVKEEPDFETTHFVNVTDTLTAVDAMEPPSIEEPTTKDVEIVDGLTLNDLLALTQEQTCGGSTIVTEAGSFNKATSTGNQVINHGLGVTPKAIIIWMAGDISTARNFLFGFSDGAASASVNGMEVHNSANSNAQRRLSNSSIVSMINSSGTVIWAATLSAWGDSTFTLNWSTNDSNALEFHYLLIGGDNVLAKVLEWGTGTSGGNLGVTGVGFQPDALIHIHEGFAAGSLPATSGAFNPCIGIVGAAGNNRAVSLSVVNGQATMNTQRGQTEKALYRISIATGAFDWSALHVSMDSDGFTINRDNPPGASNAILTLCLKGVSCKVGVFNKSTNTSVPVAQQISGIGFTPKSTIFMSVMAPANASVQDHTRIAIGASDGTNEGCASWKSEDNSANADVDTITSNTKAIQISNNDTTSIEAEADVSSFAPDEINLSWTTNNNVATEVVYMAFGDLPGASCDIVLISILDTLTALDSPSLPAKGVTVTDTARINELPGVSGNHVNKVLTIADFVNAEDTPSPSREIAVTDSFTASEFVGRVFDFLDFLSAQEAQDIQAVISLADTANVIDAAAVKILIALTDSTTLTDVLSRYADIKDTAGIQELVSLLRSTNPQADFARARDSVTVVKSGAAAFAPPERTFYARDLKRLIIVEKGKHVIR